MDAQGRVKLYKTLLEELTVFYRTLGNTIEECRDHEHKLSGEAGRLLQSMNLAKVAAKKLALAQKNAKMPVQLSNKHLRTSRLKMTKQAPRPGKAGGEGASVQSITRRQYYALTLENFNSPNTTKILELAQRKRGFLRLYCNALRYKVHGLAVETELARTQRDLDKFASNINQMSTQLGTTRDDLRKLITLHRNTQDNLRSFHQFNRSTLGSETGKDQEVAAAEEAAAGEEVVMALPGEQVDLAPAIKEALEPIAYAPEEASEEHAEEGTGEGDEEDEVEGGAAAAALEELSDSEGFWYVQALTAAASILQTTTAFPRRMSEGSMDAPSSVPGSPPASPSKRLPPANMSRRRSSIATRKQHNEAPSSSDPAALLATLNLESPSLASTTASRAAIIAAATNDTSTITATTTTDATTITTTTTTTTSTTTTTPIAQTGTDAEVDLSAINVAVSTFPTATAPANTTATANTTSTPKSSPDASSGREDAAQRAMNNRFSRGDPRSRLLRSLQVGGTSSRFLSQSEEEVESVALLKEQAAQRLIGKLEGLNLLILKDLRKDLAKKDEATPEAGAKKSLGFASFGRF